ncbi:MAG: Replication factor C large subunit [Methanomassiliicoccales archaeon PtaU1.Bin124]|nr:MAG: Replication factor C large subunit [Methanomassiliicoccales archaeon PtaU1.Bin124]
MNDDWTELYRPENLGEVLGNPKAIKDLRDWAISWEAGSPTYKAVVIMGPPGTGKTSTALAMAKEFGWGVVEMNASDQRNAEAIKRVAVRGALSDTFTDTGEFLSAKDGRRKLIILDEVDNVFGREDYGGMPAIAELVRNTKQPVVLICNDFYELSRRSSVIKNETLQIKYSRVSPATVRTVLKKVAADQRVEVDEKVLIEIADRSNGDVRAAIRDLQAVSLGTDHVMEGATSGLSDRLSVKSMYDVMGDILHGTNPRKARTTMMDADEQPDYVMKWLDENIALEYRESEDLSRAYDLLSKSSMFLGRVQRRQYYGFWAYASELMSYGICLAKAKPYKAYVRYNFPRTLLYMSRSKEARGVKAEVLGKIGFECHTSIKQAEEDLLPYFRELFLKNHEFQVSMALKLALVQEEAAYLMDQKVDAPAVKHLMAEIAGQKHPQPMEEEPVEKPKRGRKKKEETPPPPPVKVAKIDEPKPAPKEEPKEEAKGKQKSLFEF